MGEKVLTASTQTADTVETEDVVTAIVRKIHDLYDLAINRAEEASHHEVTELNLSEVIGPNSHWPSVVHGVELAFMHIVQESHDLSHIFKRTIVGSSLLSLIDTVSLHGPFERIVEPELPVIAPTSHRLVHLVTFPIIRPDKTRGVGIGFATVKKGHK